MLGGSRIVSFAVSAVALLLLNPAPSFACHAKSILVRGQIENAPPSATVLVELIYKKDLVGESDRLILDSRAFKTRIVFSTTGTSVDLMGHDLGKCGRQPQRVAVVLSDGDDELDRVTLAFPRDFQQTDASEFSVRQDVLLRGK
jgi:hypothetical protein